MLKVCYSPGLWEDNSTQAACEVVAARLDERAGELLGNK